MLFIRSCFKILAFIPIQFMEIGKLCQKHVELSHPKYKFTWVLS